MLDDDQVAQFHRDGFTVIPGFVDLESCAELRDRALQLMREWDPPSTRSVFTTDEQQRVSDQAFFDSAGAIAGFYEADGQTINKLGHAMHDLDPVFERFTYTEAVSQVVRDVGLVDPLVLQSMYICKEPEIGGEVGCHQDATYLYTDPISVTGLWFALEDARIDNGCLWVAPGAHLGGLRQVFERTDDPHQHNLTRFRQLDPTPLPPPEQLVPVEVPAGTLVVLHGLLPHWSDVNHSSVSRHAYTVHCISAAAEYPAWNWLQRPDHMPLRALTGAAA